MRARPSGNAAARKVIHGQRVALDVEDGHTRSQRAGPGGTLKVATRVRIPLGVPAAANQLTGFAARRVRGPTRPEPDVVRTFGTPGLVGARPEP